MTWREAALDGGNSRRKTKFRILSQLVSAKETG